MPYLSLHPNTIDQNGFSLLEVLLYLGLFALLLSNLVFLGFTTKDRSQNIRTNWESLNEINFVHDKLAYLTEASTIITPQPDSSSDYLELQPRDGSEAITIKAVDQQLQIERDDTSSPVTTARYKITNLSFAQSINHQLEIKFNLNDTAYTWYIQTYPESP